MVNSNQSEKRVDWAKEFKRAGANTAMIVGAFGMVAFGALGMASIVATDLVRVVAFGIAMLAAWAVMVAGMAGRNLLKNGGRGREA